MKEHSPDTHHDMTSNTLFGFWIYLMTDFVLFATVFATYAVLSNNTAGGPSAKEALSLSSALGETMVLLFSSFTCSMGMLSLTKQKMKKALRWFFVTLFLGALFLWLEWNEFSSLIQEGNNWQRSAFLSSYFTLVGLHGLHIALGLLFLLVFLFEMVQEGPTLVVKRRLTCFSLFWYFSYVIWVCVFAIVYLMGAVQ